ncbi:hypothetical protein [Nodularia sp. NIES-3585]|uniref:hypothetical protein n=1 Tax=Nodularia sp. NIES-3585 TaxID=1973477 RepID=UPI000B744A9E|nr:hypothetical protein [Nodularia sp. NIES-3585]GAX36126.1 hypothetical protein NIES3585_21520 [Nodularia sp. NIES-3585]
MKLKAKIAIALVAATTSVFGLSSGAIAGEGGAAGSAAFTITNGSVVGVAVAAAIGKNDAASYARQQGGENIAAALGSAGAITMNDIGGTVSILGADDPDLGTAQANSLTASTTLTIGTASNATLVNINP